MAAQQIDKEEVRALAREELSNITELLAWISNTVGEIDNRWKDFDVSPKYQ
jgi:hypothetical protein